MSATPEIFISYAWGENREEIVDKLYDRLMTKGYNVIRDKVNLGFRGNIRQFMERIGAGKAVIIVLSEKYLKSKNCMFEALQINNHGNIEQRIFPIILPDANIYDALIRINYLKYWTEKISELNSALHNLTDLAFIKSLNDELNLYSDIRRFIDEFMSIVGNMNILTPEIHKNNDFNYLINALDELFTQDSQNVTS